jgi:hypothetical protein
MLLKQDLQLLSRRVPYEFFSPPSHGRNVIALQRSAWKQFENLISYGWRRWKLRVHKTYGLS